MAVHLGCFDSLLWLLPSSGTDTAYRDLTATRCANRTVRLRQRKPPTCHTADEELTSVSTSLLSIELPQLPCPFLSLTQVSGVLQASFSAAGVRALSLSGHSVSLLLSVVTDRASFQSISQWQQALGRSNPPASSSWCWATGRAHVQCDQ